MTEKMETRGGLASCVLENLQKSVKITSQIRQNCNFEHDQLAILFILDKIYKYPERNDIK